MRRSRAAVAVAALVTATMSTTGHAGPAYCGVATDVVGDATVAPGGSSAGAGVVPSEPALDITRAELLVTDQQISVRLTVRDLTRPATPDVAGHSYFIAVTVQDETSFGFTADVTSAGERGVVSAGPGTAAAANVPEHAATVRVDEKNDQVTITARSRDLAGAYLGSGSRLSDPLVRTARMAVVLVPGTSRTTAYLPADYASSSGSLTVGGSCRTA